MHRPKFESIYMQLAHLMAERSTCKRLKVGCVVTSTDYSYVYGVGYNGNAKGLDNECDSTTPGECGCLHAELNAMLKVNVCNTTPKVLFCTHAPCKMCAKTIINKGGFEKVIYDIPYRLSEGLDLLTECGIVVEHV